MPANHEGTTPGSPEYFWVLWQELYDVQELEKPRMDWKCPVLCAIRKMLWRHPEHISEEEFCEWLVNSLEDAVRGDLVHTIKKGLPPNGWKATIRNLDAWLTRSAANAAEDLRRRNIPGYRAEVRYHIVHLAPRPEQPQGGDLFDQLPAPARNCSDSNELLCRFFHEGEGSPINEQCLEHLRACASCARLLQYAALGFRDFLHHASDRVVRPRFVRFMDELGMLNCARQFLRNVRRSIMADLQRYEALSRSHRSVQAGLLRLGEALPVIDRNLELMRTPPRRRKRNLRIRRGTLAQTFVRTQVDLWRLLLLLLVTRSLPCRTVLSSYHHECEQLNDAQM
jgi:hypothetical protein